MRPHPRRAEILSLGRAGMGGADISRQLLIDRSSVYNVLRYAGLCDIKQIYLDDDYAGQSAKLLDALLRAHPQGSENVVARPEGFLRIAPDSYGGGASALCNADGGSTGRRVSRMFL